MQLPYVSAPQDAFLTAQVSTASVLTVIAFARRASAVPTVFLIAGLWTAAFASHLARSFLFAYLPPLHYAERHLWVLGISSLLYVLATLFQRRGSVQAVATVGALAIALLGRLLANSTDELAALELVFGGLLCGMLSTSSEVPSSKHTPRLAYYELSLFAIGLGAATFVAVDVLGRFVLSGDEWAYQYQADLFAHGRIYGPVPECPTLHMTYWIYYWMGRAFSQYPPSWPLVLAPFQRFGVHWLANPVVFGIGLVGVSRLSRRAALGNNAGAPLTTEALAAGLLGPLVLSASGAMLLNAGSLFSHPLVCTLFAWLVEALFVVTTPGLTRRAELGWALALGAMAAFLLGARPSDGAAILPSLGLYAVYTLDKGRWSTRAFAAAALGFLLVGAVILVILRIQLGVWFATGYSLTDKFHPWATIEFGWPKPDEWKYGIPLATGAYCFWPCSLAVAAFGAVVAYRRAPHLPLVLIGAMLMIFAFYSAVVAGRHADWGYGPRYVMAILIPISVFSGVALAQLFVPLYARIWAYAAPAAVALSAIVYGTWFIGGLFYPVAKEEIRVFSAPFRAIKEQRLKNAVVAFSKVALDPADLTQNLPSVENPDVIYVMERSYQEMRCGRRLYPNRKWYRAYGYEEVQLVPYY